MADQRPERRLAAIFAADVVGYSRLMGADEEGTLARLSAHQREFFEPTVARHRGRIVKWTGDGVLIEFASVVDAARCAVEVQRGIVDRNVPVPPDKRIELRVGIHLGDVILEDQDIFGDGVNVASRLEGLAPPGGICISEDAHRQVRGKLEIDFQDLGERQLKNIAQPIRVYEWRPDAPASPGISLSRILQPDKPSIAVLPFQNMSSDPEQEYFADGMVEEITTALSRMRWLLVIARNSSFTYKGRNVDIKQVGRDLGVRYVLEGSVRKSADKVRITGQLIDTASGTHLWADRFEGALKDIFDLQDLVTANVVGAIGPKIERAEMERAKQKPTEDLRAYDFFLRGKAALHAGTQMGNDQALDLFYKAIAIDKEFASAHGHAAYCYVWRQANGWMKDRIGETGEAIRLARCAAELGDDDAEALCFAGFALARAAGDLVGGATLLEKAIMLNPNLAAAWGFSGRIKVYLGQPEQAIDHLAHAMRLSPLDPEIYGVQGSTAFAHYFCGRYDEASVWAQRAMRENPSFLPVVAIAAATYAMAGRLSEAGRAIQRLQQIAPTLRISNLKDHFVFSRSEDMQRLAAGLEKAELPRE